MMHPDSLSLARYRLPLETSLPVGKQRIEQRAGLVIKASCGDEGHFVEVAPLSGLDANGEPLLGFSRESLAEVTEAALALMQALATKELKLSQAADCLSVSLARLGAKVCSMPNSRDNCHSVGRPLKPFHSSITGKKSHWRCCNKGWRRFPIRFSEPRSRSPRPAWSRSSD